jgi:hypothetical protein
MVPATGNPSRKSAGTESSSSQTKCPDPNSPPSFWGDQAASERDKELSLQQAISADQRKVQEHRWDPRGVADEGESPGRGLMSFSQLRAWKEIIPPSPIVWQREATRPFSLPSPLPLYAAAVMIKECASLD